jgi:hypothetical protein
MWFVVGRVDRPMAVGWPWCMLKVSHTFAAGNSSRDCHSTYRCATDCASASRGLYFLPIGTGYRFRDTRRVFGISVNAGCNTKDYQALLTSYSAGKYFNFIEKVTIAYEVFIVKTMTTVCVVNLY